ncbi:hypothetical protein NOCA2350072 [metagenome]|uniref:Uncharacterized protein n=1 Tax=metagenome TaxID=256318 RepID=A0A2P2C3L1_9ZZZZ
MNAQRDAECLLRPALVEGEVAQQSEVAWVKGEGGETLSEPPMPVRPQLGQQESSAVTHAVWLGRLSAAEIWRHDSTIVQTRTVYFVDSSSSDIYWE